MAPPAARDGSSARSSCTRRFGRKPPHRASDVETGPAATRSPGNARPSASRSFGPKMAMLSRSFNRGKAAPGTFSADRRPAHRSHADVAARPEKFESQPTGPIPHPSPPTPEVEGVCLGYASAGGSDLEGRGFEVVHAGGWLAAPRQGGIDSISAPVIDPARTYPSLVRAAEEAKMDHRLPATDETATRLGIAVLAPIVAGSNHEWALEVHCARVRSTRSRTGISR